MHELGGGNEPSSEDKGMAQIPNLSDICVYENRHFVTSFMKSLIVSLLIAEPSSSVVDANKQVLSKRPMSRMKVCIYLLSLSSEEKCLHKQ